MNFLSKADFKNSSSLQRLDDRLEKLNLPIKQGLYFKGDLELLNAPKVAIVGSRRATIYTRELVSALAAALAGVGAVVVSGGALGCDIAAHKAALSHTIGVFGNGLDIIYPPSNSATIKQIYQNALALSEYAPSTPSLPVHFLERNRIVVGLCDAVVVAQADFKSGSMSSARYANLLDVPLFVLPQRLQESLGTNTLLESGKARLIADFSAFASQFGSPETKQTKKQSQDELLSFCAGGADLNEALERFGEKVYEYELMGKIEIKNLRAFSV